jgi:hypothetical protein
MKNILKAWLRTDFKTKNANVYSARLITQGDIDCEGIIAGMYNDGLVTDYQQALDIINGFNRKAAEMVVSGYNVNTGLVKMSSEIKGLIYGKTWNPSINRVDVSIRNGVELSEVIRETTVEILSDQLESENVAELNEGVSHLLETAYGTSAINKSNYLNSEYDNPACGIAFRRWLCKA